MHTFLRDFRYALRQLRKSPGFTLTSILTLALGIGANIAVFSVVNTLLLRPLPFRDANRLMWIAPSPTKCGISCATFSTDAYDEFRVYNRTFQDVTGYNAFTTSNNLSLRVGAGAPIPATSIDVIANFFQLLGVEPAMGRAFRPEDGRSGAAPVILITDAWWKTQFNADPNIVGKAFDMNGIQTTVIGVLPRSFDFGAVFSPGVKVDALTPVDLYGPVRHAGNNFTFIGRAKPGVTLAQAQEDAQATAPHMCWSNNIPQSCGSYARRNGEGGLVPVPLKEYVSGKLHRSLVVLWSAVGAILLIACLNLSNLLLARAAARSKEFAMRSVLGATRTRIVRQLLVESLVLSSAGAVAGLAFAAVVLDWLRHQGAIALPLLNSLQIDGAALGWTVLIAVFAAVFFGLIPGLRMASGNLQELLKDSGPGSGSGRKHERLRSTLVVSEVALACVLLVGAGLLLRSFLKVLDVDLGFEPQHAVAVMVDYNIPGKTRVERLQNQTLVFQQILNRVGSVPGIQAAGIVDYLPLGRNRSWGLPFPKGIKRPQGLSAGPLVYVITPGYMRSMGTRITGRDFTWDDGPNSTNVVLINKAFARFLANYTNWPSGSAVGQLLNDGNNDLLIVGIVDDVHAEGTEGDAGWQIYYPISQNFPNYAQLVVRTTLPPTTMATSVLTALRELNPKQPAAEFRPLQSMVDHANSPRRFFMLLVDSFAALGLILAALGIYGVISYSVTQRTQEIGIRLALGSQRTSIMRLVLASGVKLGLIGCGIGAIGAIFATRLLRSVLFQVDPLDPAVIVLAATSIFLLALIAAVVPARRAASIEPMQALRSE